MTELRINLAERGSAIKPMNAINNGPMQGGVRKSYNNFDTYKALNIPYARNHDAAFFTGYGGEHTVDVHRIFKNFDADENDPASYIFEPTDKYVKTIYDAGTKVFYRLGASIEHDYKYGTRVPKDFAKWARICEHIIRHYNEGWANGFHYGIEYWEIWNEPECRNHDGSNPCWQGTDDEFLEFYGVVSHYLKKTFPNLKIGGPAFCNPWPHGDKDLKTRLLDSVAEGKAYMDFYSFHWYGCRIEDIIATYREGRQQLDRRGLTGVTTILNEWNYIRGWVGDQYNYSSKTMRNLKGSSFIAGIMCAGQHEPIDMLMYYDARPSVYNGLFAHETFECLKGYYPFAMFNALAQLGTHIPTEYVKDDIYSCAATDGENYAVMLTHFNDDDETPAKTLKLDIENSNAPVKVSCYVLDENHDLELFREEAYTSDKLSMYFDMPLFTSVLVKIEKL
ncbi:MAG: hypothetical protein IKU43_03545 [Clostridia bacterium]|nr:hypothetical protein [Clostridia bacterium]